MGLGRWVLDQAAIPFEQDEEEIAMKWLHFAGYASVPAFALGSSLPFLLLAKKRRRSPAGMAGLCMFVGTTAVALTVYYASHQFGKDILESDTQMGRHAREAYCDNLYHRYLMAGGSPELFTPPTLPVKSKRLADSE